ncbi:MAG: DMT family transporter [Thermoleophilia bacterium]|nr:DMT family transporter [Thermoleophilia bacterium]
MTAVFLAWTGVALLEAALSGGASLLDKRLLNCLDPMATNMLVRATSVVTILVVTAPLTLLDLWDLTYDMTWAAAGYIAALAVVGWLIGQNFYYFALRSGRVSVVIPIASTDLLFTALFATLFVGSALGGLTITGLLVAVAGVSAIAWAERADAASAARAADVPVAEELSGESVPSTGALQVAPARSGPVRSLPVAVLLALASAAGWGLAPVLIQLAQESVGATSVTMIVEAQALGLVMIMVAIRARRASLTTHRLTPVERRRATILVLVTGIVAGSCAVMFYLVIEHLGSVQAAVIAATSPIFAIVWSALFLRERLSGRLAFGVAVTLLGVFLATVERLG